MSDFDRAEFRRNIQALQLQNALTIVKILHPNDIVDEGELRSACSQALLFMDWFHGELQKSIK